VTAEEA
jgi:hypothetical protein